jgi:hypothetical protein
MAFLTMEVLGRYWRAQAATRGHVSPGNRHVARCLTCPLVSEHARAGVPVSYLRAVVSFSNSKRRTTVTLSADSCISRADV